jgi:hypothetical protein
MADALPCMFVADCGVRRPFDTLRSQARGGPSAIRAYDCDGAAAGPPGFVESRGDGRTRTGRPTTTATPDLPRWGYSCSSPDTDTNDDAACRCNGHDMTPFAVGLLVHAGRRLCSGSNYFGRYLSWWFLLALAI